MACGDKYLDQGRLYVARFAADGTGEWVELTLDHPAIAGYAGYAFADQADVVVNARLAADAVGATRMDRPEWSAVHPGTGEVYYTLTNNASRTPDKVDAANPRSYFDASFDAEEDALVFRRLSGGENWLAVLKECPVSPDDVPPRRRAPAKRRKL